MPQLQAIAEKDQTGTWTDYIYGSGAKIAKISSSADPHLHVSATAPTTGLWQWYDIGAMHGYTIQAKDVLSWRQFIGGNGAGGIYISTVQGPGTAWGIRDSNGNFVNQDTVRGAWEFRTADLSVLAGDQISIFCVGLDQATSGAGTIDYADIVITSQDGTVHTVFNGQGVSFSPWSGNNSMQNPQASFVSTPVTGASPSTPTHFYLADHLGSTAMEFSSGGYPVWMDQYAPFGGELNSQPTVNHYKFTGKERDTESGNDYFGYRYFGSSMGRWTSPDPSGLVYADPTNPQSLNLYSYVLNNPLIAVDPDGLDCIYTNNLTSDSVTVETVSGDCRSPTDNGVFVDGTVNTDSYKAQVGSDGDVHLGYGYTSDDGSGGVSNSGGNYTLSVNSGSTDIGAAVQGNMFSMSQDDRIQQLAQGVTADSQHSFGCIGQAYKTEAEGLIPSVGVGVPLPGSKRFQGWGASDGTSLASRTLASGSDAIKSEYPGFSAGRYRSPTGGLFSGGKPFEMKTTPNMGRAAGRYAPYIGTAITTAVASWNLGKCL